jgi:hypothetical protein
MVTITSLWLAILLAGVAVFIVSSIVHMVLPYHKNDYIALPDEAAALDALRKLNIPPGSYHAPHCASSAAMKDPVFIEKVKRGPMLMLNLRAGGNMNMGSTLAQWFLYTLIVSLFAAYLCTRALTAGATYPAVFRMAGFAAFLAYAGGQPIESIWFWRKWSVGAKNIFDGLLYGLLTGGVFGWLWPR